MTLEEFSVLRKDDVVRLPFSSNPSQRVGRIEATGLVHTHPYGSPEMIYVNHYDDIEFVRHYNEEAERKNKEVKDHIVGLFNGFKCETCPFKTECDAMYGKIRSHTTDTFNLCDVIKNRLF